jgi:hypothetical protein
MTTQDMVEVVIEQAYKKGHRDGLEAAAACNPAIPEGFEYSDEYQWGMKAVQEAIRALLKEEEEKEER